MDSFCLKLNFFKTHFFIFWFQNHGIWSKPYSDNYRQCIHSRNHKSSSQNSDWKKKNGTNFFYLIFFFKWFHLPCRVRWENKWVHFNQCKWWIESNEIWGLSSNHSIFFFCFWWNQNISSVQLQICDMVAIAKVMKATLVLPSLDHTSYWADERFGILNTFLLDMRSKVQTNKYAFTHFKFKWWYITRNKYVFFITKLHPWLPFLVKEWWEKFSLVLNKYLLWIKKHQVVSSFKISMILFVIWFMFVVDSRIFLIGSTLSLC